MEANRIDELVAKYNEGVADPSEVQQVEKLLEEGAVELTQLRSLQLLDDQLERIQAPAPSLRMDDNFYEMLGKAKQKSISRSLFNVSFDWSWLAPRLALGAFILIAGFSAGYLFQGKKEGGNDVAELTTEVQQLKEMMMLSLLEKESVTERLRAVSLTTDMDKVSQKVTNALFETLNNDESVNVRLAALEALTPYSKQGPVREELIRSIGKQDSPLVQVALAELMGALQEKKSVTELQKILDSDKTPKDAKSRIKESMKVLI
jgi:hypothetical protein